MRCNGGRPSRCGAPLCRQPYLHAPRHLKPACATLRGLSADPACGWSSTLQVQVMSRLYASLLPGAVATNEKIVALLQLNVALHFGEVAQAVSAQWRDSSFSPVLLLLPDRY